MNTDYMRWNDVSPQRVVGASPVISFKWLCDMMQSRQRVVLFDSNNTPVTGIIGQIQAEDGSGKCWNLLVGERKVFVRTV
jgi:hypothetical protein